MMEDFAGFVANVGFPIAVTSFLLLRIEERLKEVGEKVDQLNDRILHSRRYSS